MALGRVRMRRATLRRCWHDRPGPAAPRPPRAQVAHDDAVVDEAVLGGAGRQAQVVLAARLDQRRVGNVDRVGLGGGGEGRCCMSRAARAQRREQKRAGQLQVGVVWCVGVFVCVCAVVGVKELSLEVQSRGSTRPEHCPHKAAASPAR